MFHWINSYWGLLNFVLFLWVHRLKGLLFTWIFVLFIIELLNQIPFGVNPFDSYLVTVKWIKCGIFPFWSNNLLMRYVKAYLQVSKYTEQHSSIILPFFENLFTLLRNRSERVGLYSLNLNQRNFTDFQWISLIDIVRKESLWSSWTWLGISEISLI